MVESHGEALRVLVVDDEKAIRNFLRLSLSARGFSVFEAATAKEALDAAVSSHPDVILLDLGLPDLDGVDATRRLRRRSRTPIIILSVRDKTSEKIAALDAGADDYLTKPFSIEELLARLRAVMRRLLPDQDAPIINIGRLSLDITGRQVTTNGTRLRLTPTEYDVLKLLVLNAGRVTTHGRILREIWDKSEDSEGVLHLLRVTISNLRNKVEPDPDRPVYIVTDPGIGYRFRSED